MPDTSPTASQIGRIGAHVSWANTVDRSARTAAARAARDQKFLDAAGGDPVRAAHLRKAYFQRLALKSAQARRKAKGSGSPPGDARHPSTTARPADKGANGTSGTRPKAEIRRESADSGGDAA